MMLCCEICCLESNRTLTMKAIVRQWEMHEQRETFAMKTCYLCINFSCLCHFWRQRDGAVVWRSNETKIWSCLVIGCPTRCLARLVFLQKQGEKLESSPFQVTPHWCCFPWNVRETGAKDTATQSLWMKRRTTVKDERKRILVWE